VDHRGTSQTCPNCRAEVRKDLSVRLSECYECGYVTDRDIASGQEICNRGEETYRGTPEKQEIDERPRVGVRGRILARFPYPKGYPLGRLKHADLASGATLRIFNPPRNAHQERERARRGSQVVLSGNFVVDKWRNSANTVRGARSIGDNGSPLSIA
ncbi:MAG: zinc ribbon domain-containing protein, partial [Xenococcus sp. (in: cyanobacteria)]